MPDPNDARRRLLLALALERSRAGSPVDGALRRALEGERATGERSTAPGPKDEVRDDASRS